jgi:hypothetical protein
MLGRINYTCNVQRLDKYVKLTGQCMYLFAEEMGMEKNYWYTIDGVYHK